MHDQFKLQSSPIENWPIMKLLTYLTCVLCACDQSLKVGTLVLGCIKEVTDFEVMVSLPSGLMGYLAISNISDSYTKMVREQLDSDTEVRDCCSWRVCVYIRCSAF